jgi:aspartyl protease family protein
VKAALGLVIGGGLLLGFVAPFDRFEHVSARPETSRASAAAPVKPKRPNPAPARPARWGGETRLERAPNGHFYANAAVNGQPIELVVDTGASTVALTVEDARRAGINVDPSRFDVIGTGASGPVRGHPVTIRSISVDSREVRNLDGVVLEGLEVSLLGQSYLSRLEEVRMSGGEMILR